MTSGYDSLLSRKNAKLKNIFSQSLWCV